MTLFNVDISSIIILLIAGYVTRFYYKYLTRQSPLPGPIPLPLVGNILTFTGDIAVWPSELQAKYGDIFEVYVGPTRNVWLCNEELPQKIFSSALRNNFHDRVSKDCGLDEVGMINVALAFNLNYDEWTYVRKFYLKTMFTPAFMRQALACTQSTFQLMEGYWAKLGEDTVLDFSEWSRGYLMDSAFFLTTGNYLDVLTDYYNKLSPNSDPEISDGLLKEKEYFRQCATDFINLELWFYFAPKIVRDLPIIRSYTKKCKDKIEYLRENLLKIVKARREEIERTPEDEKLVPDFLTMFLTVNTPRDITKGIADDINGRPMTDKEIVNVFLEVSAAAPGLVWLYI
ncbi:15858_t:CDS:1 [Acaulospora colombiana]|uniref:15858_t:CDS:1 n=1 Tax=Acaulospora colombiana TaxID=27376 RepID=A0ACA9JWS6_9GLOM|nr:15858_t:CDS:1 [Acaulospora colombiana]